jgi:PAS domain S-box-containing protein
VERALGYKPEELVGRSFAELNIITPEYLDKAVKESLMVLSGERIISSTYQFITKDGAIRFGEVSGVPFMRDGKARAVISVARDITERIEMEKSLRESEERFRTIFESAQDCIYIKNLNYEYVFVNPCIEKLFGVSSKDILGKKNEELCLRDVEPDISENDRKVLDGDIVEGEYSRVINGSLLTFNFIKTPIRDSSGKVTGLCGIARDITERKRFEEQLLAKERELAQQARYLEEMNITLNVLLDSREKEKKQAQEAVVSRVRKIIYPYLEKIESSDLDDENRIYLSIVKANLDELLSPYTNPLSQQYLNFTPMEMRIADLIRQGKTTKEISTMLKVSAFAISFHRSNIRKKCGLLKAKKNLSAYLNTIEQGL